MSSVLCAVDALRKDCKFVDLSLIPRPVISLFQRLKQRKGPVPSPSSVGMDWSRIDSKLSSTLMQFQREGVEYVCTYNVHVHVHCHECWYEINQLLHVLLRYSVVRGGRVLIADDMGLGKTLQAIAVMSHYQCDWPLLVICPSSVRLTWAEVISHVLMPQPPC